LPEKEESSNRAIEAPIHLEQLIFAIGCFRVNFRMFEWFMKRGVLRKNKEKPEHRWVFFQQIFPIFDISGIIPLREVIDH
jgi:hypothetical protein